VHGVDLRALLDAVRTARDGEFVTVQGTTGYVRVVKEDGYLQEHVRENKETSRKRVEVRVPLTVVDALLSAGSNELDLVAAIHALAAQGDTELVTVRDAKSTVRIWLDSKSTSD
jgi:ribonuclease HI